MRGSVEGTGLVNVCRARAVRPWAFGVASLSWKPGGPHSKSKIGLCELFGNKTGMLVTARAVTSVTSQPN